MYASKRWVVLILASLPCTVSAFPQAGVASMDGADQLGEEVTRPISEKQIFAGPAFNISEHFETVTSSTPGAREHRMFDPQGSLLMLADKSAEDSEYERPGGRSGSAKPADFSRAPYYRNKLEFSLEGGWHPINIPFPLDVFVGDAYNSYSLKYTLVPIFASLRWHLGGPWGPSILHGNFDLTFTGSVTGVARGPENRYFAYLMWDPA